MATAEFDRVADVYDDTRRPLHAETLGGLVGMLDGRRCRSILEVGVGTGRISVPLSARGFQMTGLDLSRRMMERALAKGITDLVLADARKPPFRSDAFDAGFMAHVFHLLEDPLAVMREVAKVVRVGVFALVRVQPGDWAWFTFLGGEYPSKGPASEEATRRREERRAKLMNIAAKYDWKWDPEARARNWRREQEILVTHRPDELKVVSDVVVTDTLDERIERLRKGAYSFMANMPSEMKDELIRMMKADAASHPELARRSRHEAYQVGFWSSRSLLRS